MNTYKGYRITKRNGMDMRRRPISGYRVAGNGIEIRNFSTLAEAKSYVDSKVNA